MLDRRLLLYSLRGCAQCDAARTFLEARGLAFVERDIRDDAGAVHELTTLTGESFVPTIVFGDDVQIGWDPARVAQMLDDPLPPEEEDKLLASIEAAARAESLETPQE